MARQSAALVGTRLSFPRSHCLPRRQSRMQTAAAGAAQRGMWQRPRLLVQQRGAPSAAAEGARETKTTDNTRGSTGGLPSSSARTLERDDFSSNRHPALALWWSMIFSENRYPLFGIML